MTGIAGGLGRYLTQLFLQRGFDIVGNDLRSPEDASAAGLTGVRYLWRATENLTHNDLEGAEVVIHLSSCGDRPMGLTSPEYTWHNNTIPTVNLLEICRGLPLSRFIQLGSGTAYLGVPAEELPATEKTVPRPTNPYSASKYAQDVLCLTYHYTYGIPVSVVRSGITYGTGRLGSAPHRFIISALRNEPMIVQGGSQTRTPTHISDIAEYVAKVMTAPPEVCVGKVVNAVYPTSPDIKGEFSVLEMARLIKEITGSNSAIKVTGYDPGERIGEKPLREWIISTMAKEVGMTPKTDFRTGIAVTVKWLRGQMAAGRVPPMGWSASGTL